MANLNQLTVAEAAAKRLGLAFERRFTGLSGLERFVKAHARDTEAEWRA